MTLNYTEQCSFDILRRVVLRLPRKHEVERPLGRPLWWAKRRHNFASAPPHSTDQKQKEELIDACVIRTHAPEGISLAGLRVNHSAKAPSMMGDVVV